jgi:hypothetical protein
MVDAEGRYCDSPVGTSSEDFAMGETDLMPADLEVVENLVGARAG